MTDVNTPVLIGTVPLLYVQSISMFEGCPVTGLFAAYVDDSAD